MILDNGRLMHRFEGATTSRRWIMAVIRWTPFRELATVQERVNKLFEDVIRPPYRQDEGMTAAWAPAVDIYETDKEIVLKAEIPEMQEKDVEIKVEDNVLTVSGERKMEKEVKEESYHRIERSYGTFSRSFTLPQTVDREKIAAAYKDGVLRVTLPKREETKPKQIRIEVGK
jgi:HSP20 family protein